MSTLKAPHVGAIDVRSILGVTILSRLKTVDLTMLESLNVLTHAEGDLLNLHLSIINEALHSRIRMFHPLWKLQ